MFNAANTSQPAARFTRFVRTSLKPVIFKLSRKLSVTYWPQRRRTISLVLLAMLSPFVPTFVQAAPTGAEVVAGVAKVTKASATSTLINQSTQSAIINWQSFSIGANEMVRFMQPNSTSVALNRVIGADPSRIYGSLQANGHVFLVNNAGVYFAPGASVDVGGLVASSMDISNANFSAGRYTFTAGAHAGSVVNEGQLRGTYVVLSAPQVSNAGSIVTPGGSTALAAGGRVRMDLAGNELVSLNVDGAVADAAVRNSGNISADGGRVFMTARSANAVLDTVINTSGVVRANSLQNRNGEIVIDGGPAGVTAVSGTLAASGGDTGGTVKVLGDKVALNSGARIDVSGASGGGQVMVGGNFHGAGAERNASITYVDKNARIDADATVKGDGGKVAVWANEHTTYAGSISAKAGAQGGDGGFVETSGKQTLAFKGAVDTSAAKGRTGTLLLDPNDITITAAAGNLADNGAGTFISASNSSSTVAAADIITALATNNVRIDTTSAGTGNGNITVASALNYNRTNSLTLAAEGAISVNAGITNAGTGALNLYGNGNIGINAPISLAGGALHIAGFAGGASRANTVLNADDITTAGGNVTMQSNSVMQTGNINSGAGLINLSANNDVTINGALVTTNAGTSAVVIKAGANQAAGTSFGGNVTVSGGSISMGAGGRATLYGGSIAGSTGVTAFLGSNSGRFRYNSDAATSNFTAALGTGMYAVYREAPVLALSGTMSMVYGSADPTVAAATGLVNGDTLAQALSTQATLGLTAAPTSTAGLRVAGATATTVSGAVGQLGYTVTQTAGTLTVTPKSVNMSGLTVPASKVYDGTAAAVVGGAGVLTAENVGTGTTADGKSYTGDLVSIAGAATGTYNNAHVAGATTVTFGNQALAGADAANYTLVVQAPAAATITPATLTTTLTNAGITKTYDGTTAAPAGFTPTLNVTGFIAGDTAAAISNTGSAYNNAHVVGATQVTVSGLAITGITGSNASVAGDYALDAGSKSAAAAITAKLLTSTLTNTGVTKVYDGTTASGITPTFSFAGLVAGDTNAVLTNSGIAYDNAHVVGATQVTVSGLAIGSVTGSNASVGTDYALDAASKNVAAAITARTLTSTLTNAGVTKVYDGTTAAPGGFAPTFSFANFATGDTAATLSNTGSAYNNAHVVGATQVTTGGLALTGITGSNASVTTDYALDATSKSVAATITPAMLTSTLTNAGVTKVYDGTTAAPAGFTPTYNVTGFVAGDTAATLTNTGSAYNNAHVVGATQVTVSGLAVGAITGSNASVGTDYVLDAASKNVAAAITARTITSTLTNAGVTKVYDGTTASGITPTFSFANLATGDTTATLSNTGVAYDNAHVVGATQVTASGLAITGITGSNASVASDYALDANFKSVAASITPATLTSTLTNAGVTKVYDGTTAAPAGFTPTYNVTGFVAGDTAATISNTGSAYNNAHVVGATQVTTSGLALTGITGSNASVSSDYVLDATSKSVAANITAALLTSTLTNAGVTKVYDGTTSSSITPTYSFAGLVAGDTNAVLTNTGIAYNNAHVVGATQVTVSGLAIGSITGSNASVASDYALDAASKNVAASITARTITSTLTNAGVTKVYDGTTAAPAGFAPTFSFANFATGDTAATLSNTGTAYNNAHVVGATQVTTGGLAITGITGSNASVTTDYALDAASKSVAATITPATLTSTLTNAGVTKVYDGTTAAPAGFTPTYNVTGFVVGDTAATISNTGSAYNNAHVVGATQVTTSGLALTGITGSNASVSSDYVLDATSKSVAANITAALLTSTLTNAGVTKVYDGTTSSSITPTYSFAGLVAGDTNAVLTNTGIAYNNAHVVGATQVTVSGLAIGSITGSNASVASDYALDAASKNVAASITARTITSTLTNAGVTKVYDGTTAAPAGFAPTFSFANFATGDTAATLSNTGTAYNNAHVVGATQVTTSGLAITGITGSNASVTTDYALDAASKSVAATITPAMLTSTLTNVGVTKSYDGTLAAPAGFTPTYNVTGFVAGDTAATLTNTSALYNNAHVVGATMVTVGGLAVGTVTGSNASVASDYVLDASSKNVAANITAALLTSTLSNTGVTKTYDGTTAAPAGFTPTFTFTGLASGDTTASLTNTGSAYNNAHVVGATQVTVSGLAIGSITGSNASVASDYVLDANSKNVAASITARTLTSTLTNAGVTKVYDGTTAAPAGFVPSYNVTGFATGDTAATISNTGSAYNSAHVVGATQVTTSGLALTGITGSNASVASDYALDATSKNVAATITPAMLTSTLTNVGVTKSYDGTLAAPAGFIPTYNVTGFVAGDTAATLTNTSALYNNAHVVGATMVTVGGLAVGTVTGSNASVASDYVLDAASKNVAASITAKLLTSTLSNTGVTKTYDATTAAPAGFTPTFTFTGLASGDTNATLTNTGSAYNSAHVLAANQVTVSGLAIAGVTGSNASVASDYALDATSKNVAATITPATLTSTLTNVGVTKTYDGTTAAPAGFAPTYSVTGFVAGDTAATLTNTGSAYNTAHVSSANRVTVSGLAISGITGGNASLASDYALDATSKNVAATITAKLLTSTLTNTGVTKVYDGTLAAPATFTPTYSFVGLVAGDTTAALTNASKVYNNAHVVGATQVTVGGLAIGSVTGSNASEAADYVLDATSKTVAASITARTVTPTISNTGVTKVYDGTTAAPAGFVPSYTFANLAAGDTSATLSNTGAAYNSFHVASANKVTVSGLAITGITGSNASVVSDYALDATSKDVTAAITTRTLTSTLTNTGVTKTYDGTTAAPAGFVPAYTVTGFLAGDTAATLTNTSALYDSAHVASATRVTVGGLAVGSITGANGSLASDYGLDASSKFVAATITPATLTPTLTNTHVVKYYDTTTAAPFGFTPTYSFTGLVAGDTSATLTNTSALYNSPTPAGATHVTVGGLAIASIAGSRASLPSDYLLDATSKNVSASILPTPVNGGGLAFWSGYPNFSGFDCWLGAPSKRAAPAVCGGRASHPDGVAIERRNPAGANEVLELPGGSR
ncbi:MAG: YDG domain-containing protein [Pseudomonadota bacterium]